MTQTEKEQIRDYIISYLIANSQTINGLPDVTSLEGISSFPVIQQQDGNNYIAKKVPFDMIIPKFRYNSGYIQYKDLITGNWINILSSIEIEQNIDLSGYVKLTEDQIVDGIKTFNNSPIVPDPTTSFQAANKKYTDDGLSLKVDKSITINNYQLNNNISLSKSDIGLSNVDNTSDINKPISEQAQNALNLKADLVNGQVPASQLPSYVDDILEYPNLLSFPSEGESGKLYVDLEYNLTYRWSGSIYVEIGKSIALGETDSTAYRGDRGKTAYDHSQIVLGNPHNTKATDIVNTPSGNLTSITVQNVINELDSLKVDKITGKGLSTNDYTTLEKDKLFGISNNANNYVHPATHSADIIVDGITNKAYTATEKTKLDGITTGADVSVNSDWNAVSGKAQILNKPNLDAIVPISKGGTGLSEIGLANQLLKVNSNATGLEYFTPEFNNGSGTVTSISMSTPVGLIVSGSPITTSGTFSISFAEGYSIPTIIKQNNWDDAYSWGDHNGLYEQTIIKSAGYAKYNGSSWIFIDEEYSLVNHNHNDLYQQINSNLTAIVGLSGTSGFLKKTAEGIWALDTSTYLKANQSITLSGAVTGSGSTSIVTTYSGIVPTNKGGTGLTSIGTAGQFLTVNSSATGLEWITNRDKGVNTVTTLASLPITKRLITATVTAATTLSLAASLEVGDELHIIVYNSTASAITQTLPNTGNYISLSGTSIQIPANSRIEINILCYAATSYLIRAL